VTNHHPNAPAPREPARGETAPELGATDPGQREAAPARVETGLGWGEAAPARVDTGPGWGEAAPARVETGPGWGEAAFARGETGPGRERRRGRQAEAERNDRLVLDAARQVFAEQGPDAPVSAVAQRAGVGMGSLYRRYGSKADLLRHLCLLAMRQTIEAAEDGLAESDPWAGLVGYVRACVGFGSGSLGALAGTIESTPEMWQTSKRSRELLGALLTRAQQAGAVRPDLTVLDVAWLIELFGRHGPTWPAPPAPSSPAPASAASVEASGGAVKNRLLAIALAGLRPAPADPLPGPAPTPDLYEQRWSTRTTPPGP
jgi:AcrR family transcriptional regulator